MTDKIAKSIKVFYGSDDKKTQIGAIQNLHSTREQMGATVVISRVIFDSFSFEDVFSGPESQTPDVNLYIVDENQNAEYRYSALSIESLEAYVSVNDSDFSEPDLLLVEKIIIRAHKPVTRTKL